MQFDYGKRQNAGDSSIWVAELRISDRTAEKVASKHGLRVDDVRRAVQCVEGLDFAWDDHPERGRRAIVKTLIGNQVVLVVLYPTNDPVGDVWNLVVGMK